MSEQPKRIAELEQSVTAAVRQLKIEELNTELQKLQAQSQQSDFWNDSTQAQTIMKQIAKLETRVKPWLDTQKNIADVSELAKLNDTSLQSELDTQLGQIEQDFAALKEELKFSGPYDDHDAIVSIYAGAGGTDAQDWTQMLLRMYTRYFEKNGWSVSVVDESAGEEAGLKSITLEVEGAYSYGKLKGEHGVHRLVRLSPFNSDNLRHQQPRQHEPE